MVQFACVRDEMNFPFSIDGVPFDKDIALEVPDNFNYCTWAGFMKVLLREVLNSVEHFGNVNIEPKDLVSITKIGMQLSDTYASGTFHPSNCAQMLRMVQADKGMRLRVEIQRGELTRLIQTKQSCSKQAIAMLKDLDREGFKVFQLCIDLDDEKMPDLWQRFHWKEELERRTSREWQEIREKVERLQEQIEIMIEFVFEAQEEMHAAGSKLMRKKPDGNLCEETARGILSSPKYQRYIDGAMEYGSEKWLKDFNMEWNTVSRQIAFFGMYKGTNGI